MSIYQSGKAFEIQHKNECNRLWRLQFSLSIATASNTSFKKWIRTVSNFIELIPSRSIRPILAIFFWSWILKDFIEVQEKKKEVTLLCSRPTQNVKLEFFSS